jgi:hypothetical protein
MAIKGINVRIVGGSEVKTPIPWSVGFLKRA